MPCVDTWFRAPGRAFSARVPSAGLLRSARHFVALEGLKFVVNVLRPCNQSGSGCWYCWFVVRGGLRSSHKNWVETGADMREASDSYVVGVLLAVHSPWRRAGAVVGRLLRLTEVALDPYRPERHYMRGPGPKWREKMRRSDRGTLVLPGP
jgi:hypothetical protein